MSSPLTIMVAPNGARRTRADHPALPMTIAQTVKAVAAAAEAGASAAHLHVRDGDGRHVLDSEAYRTLLARCAREVPGIVCQITTEAVGRYSPQEQIELVRTVRPRAVSIALKELVPDTAHAGAAAAFYGWCREEKIAVQHILYEPGDLARFASLARDGVIPGADHALLFVLGRYTANQESDAGMLLAFLEAYEATKLDANWMVCAFGSGETACAAAAMTLGGHARVGFENSLWAPDGSLLADNTARAPLRHIWDVRWRVNARLWPSWVAVEQATRAEHTVR